MNVFGSSEQLFIELLQVAMGNRTGLSRIPAIHEWEEVKALCLKHTLQGVGFYALQRLAEDGGDVVPPRALLWEMYSVSMALKRQNEHLVADILNLTRILEQEGFGTCILKGQGLAMLYPAGMERMPGDIDVWVARDNVDAALKSRRKDVLRLCRRVVGHRPVFYHHTDFPLKGKEIEMHFTPSWMFAPWHNARLQRFFDEEWKRRRFVDGSALPVHDINFAAKGYYVPSAEMNVVYVLLHIYRHVFAEGVGLRQVVDYYFVLKHEVADRDRVLAVLKSLGMLPFASAVMWVMGEVFAMDEDDMLCPPDARKGRLLLDEIMKAGNFGKWDERISGTDRSSLWCRFYENMQRNLRFVCHYPSESICAPFWKTWQKMWRRANGFY